MYADEMLITRKLAVPIALIIAIALSLSLGCDYAHAKSANEPATASPKQAVAASALQAQASSKVKKPGKPSSISLVRNSKSKVTIKWGKAARAKGYQVYMKTNSGKFKLIKTTKARKLTKSGLKVGNTYCFKVRAYVKKNGKKYYGKFSTVKKKQLKAYERMIDVVKPYAYYGNWGYDEFTGARALEMGGNKYYNSFAVTANYGEDAYATYNLNGKYKKVEFVLGNTGGTDLELVVSRDDEVVKTMKVKGDSIPKKYSIPVSGVYKFDLRYNRTYWAGSLGFGNPKLYY